MEISFCGFDMHHSAGFKINRPTGTGDYLFLIMRTPTYITIRQETYYTKGHSVILFNKNAPQIWGAHNKPYINDWIQFEATEEDLRFFEEIGIEFDTLMEFQDAYALSRLVKQICTERGSTNKNSHKSVDLLLHLLFLKLSDLCASQSPFDNQLSEQLAILRNNIYSSPQSDWTIDSICSTLSISPSYLQHKYKQIFHVNIKQDITKARLEFGRYLLTNTSHSITDISRMVGYANDVHFMRVFKQETGFTPTQYRKASAT